MKINKVHAVYFSPTGNTKNVAEYIAENVAKSLGLPVSTCDFTLPKNHEVLKTFTSNDLVIFATPVYAGRVPNKILPVVQTMFEGNGALAVPVVTFGNRSFDNGLIELRNELEDHGFHTIAGAAFVAEHVFSRKLASGRPDQEDRAMIRDFSGQVAQKVWHIEELSKIPEAVSVDGIEPVPAYYRPLGIDGKPAVFLKAKPKTKESCTDCGLCAQVCPMASISRDNCREVTGICIKCMACVKICPEEAKYFDDPALLSHIAMLEENYSRRADNSVFL